MGVRHNIAKVQVNVNYIHICRDMELMFLWVETYNERRLYIREFCNEREWTISDGD